MASQVAGEGAHEMAFAFGESQRTGRIWKGLCGWMNKEIEECDRAAREPGAGPSSWTGTLQSTGGETRKAAWGGPEYRPWHLNGLLLAT